MQKAARIDMLDIARGVALVAMTVFHFAFDLELFGYQEQGFISQPHWKYFARAIATTFLFLTGFSLYLAHNEAIRWASWRIRMLKICGAALIVTLATYFATPQQFIFFGILHAIAFASVAGLLVFRFPPIIIIALAVGVFAIGQTYETPMLDHWSFWWTGLSYAAITSSDYVPVFPWFSAPLLGIAAAKMASSNGMLEPLFARRMNSTPARVLKFMGQNSLVYYLVHQPVMIGLILGWQAIAGT